MLVAALVGVQVGMATVASRFVIADTGPIMLGAMRYGVGVLCVLPFLLRSGRMRFASLDIVPITALGLIQFAVLIVFFNIALQHAPAARVALVFSVFPLLTMLLAAILGRERLTGAKTVGVVATIAGVALALGERAVGGIGDASWIGEAAAFGAALCGAVCSVLYRPYLARNPALAVSAYAMLVSAVALLVFAVVTGDVWAMRPLSAIGIAAITFVGVSSGLRIHRAAVGVCADQPDACRDFSAARTGGRVGARMGVSRRGDRGDVSGRAGAGGGRYRAGAQTQSIITVLLRAVRRGVVAATSDMRPWPCDLPASASRCSE